MDEDELALRLTEIRLNCAFNFPAMVMFSTDMKQDSIDSLFSVFRSLASDSFCEVRRKIAAGFYEVSVDFSFIISKGQSFMGCTMS